MAKVFTSPDGVATVVVRFGVTDTYEFLIGGQVRVRGEVPNNHLVRELQRGRAVAQVALPAEALNGVIYRPTLIYALPENRLLAWILPSFVSGCHWQITTKSNSRAAGSTSHASTRRAEIGRRFFELIHDTLNVSIDAIKWDSDLVADFNADSLDIVELVMACEEEFNIDEIELEALESLEGRIRTVEDAVSALYLKVPHAWQYVARETSGSTSRPEPEATPGSAADHYLKILGITGSNPTWQDIRKAFLELAKKYHPDTYKSIDLPDHIRDLTESRFREIKAAYESLRERFQQR